MARSDEGVYASEYSPEEWSSARKKLARALSKSGELIRAKENAAFIFPEGTRIRPQNIRTGQYYGWRTLREMVFADHVLDKEGKSLKIEGLCVWQTLNGTQVWDGKKKKAYSLSEGDKFLAYTRNAQRNKDKKKK